MATKVTSEIHANRSNGGNSLRSLAARHKVCKTTMAKVLKATKFKLRKKTVVPRTSTKTKQEHADCCRKFLQMRESGEIDADSLV